MSNECRFLMQISDPDRCRVQGALALFMQNILSSTKVIK